MTTLTETETRELARLRAAVARERTARQEAEAIAERGMRLLYHKAQELELLQWIADAANRASRAGEALQAAVDRICAYTSWPVGHVYIVEPGETPELVPAAIWHFDHPERYTRFRAMTEATRLPPGIGLPGQVFVGARPIWIVDVTAEPNFPRGPAAAECGLRAAFAFPVWAGAKVAAVCEFFAPAILAPDEGLLRAMVHIGTQLGRVVERERSDEAIAHSEERYRRLVELSPDAVFVNRGARIAFVNDAALRLFGADRPEQLLGRDPFDFLHPDFHKLVRERVRHLLNEGTSVPLVHQRIVRLDGTHVDVEVAACSFRDAGETAIQVILRDVTSRRSLEEQLRQAQKMEAIGQLAGGVAHDFNNLLTVINGYSELLLRDLKPEHPGRGLVEEIREAGERAAMLTRQLLTFSRKQVVAPRVIDLGATIADAEKMLRRLIGEDVILATNLARGLPGIKADPGQVEQVLMNLCINARDALPTGGRLTIETAAVDLDEEYAQAHAGVVPGRYIMLAVSDTGCGMDEATRARIFEPFFTTKGVGSGTGLGLATVFGIVQQAGGHVWVYSEVGRGTTFKIYFPAVAAAPAPDRANGLAPAVRGGNEQVLLLEDEAPVRAFARLALKAKGYAVLEARDGEEALRLAAEHVGSIDLLVTDVVMPGMGGCQAAERLAAERPGLKVLFVSGYADDAVVRHGVLRAETQFLQKPYSATALLTKVREILDGASTGVEA